LEIGRITRRMSSEFKSTKMETNMKACGRRIKGMVRAHTGS
jgi:hypothetical protein